LELKRECAEKGSWVALSDAMMVCNCLGDGEHVLTRGTLKRHLENKVLEFCCLKDAGTLMSCGVGCGEMSTTSILPRQTWPGQAGRVMRH
jgi:hypothetical protein